MSERREGRLRLAAVLLALAALVGQGLFVLARSVPLQRSPDDPTSALAVLIAAAFGATGLALAWLRPRNSIGWLLLLVGVLHSASAGGGAFGTLALARPELGLPGGVWAVWISSWAWLPGALIPVTVLLVRYPTGTAPSRPWRVVEQAAWAGLGLVTLALMLAPDGVDDYIPGLVNPVAAPADVTSVLVTAGFAVLIPATAVCVLGLGVRLWRASAPERQQIAWLLTVAVAALAVTFLVPWDDDVLLPTVAFCLVPVAVAVGVVRYRLLGIEVVLRRGLVYGCLTGLVVLTYAATSAALSGIAAAGAAPSVLAAALVSAVLTPARTRVQRGVDRLLYGDRRDPLRAVARLGEQTVSAAASSASLPAVAELVARSLRAPHVAIRDETGEVLAAYRDPRHGETPRPAAAELPLRHAGQLLGTLVVTVRVGQRAWSAADQALLTALAPQVALTVAAAQLTHELEAARQNVVEVVLAERDRVRRDLQDGLAPALSGAALGLEAAVTKLQSGRGPQPSADLLSHLDCEVRAAAREVRRLLIALRDDPAGTGRLRPPTGATPDGSLGDDADANRAAPPSTAGGWPLASPDRGDRPGEQPAPSGTPVAAASLTAVVLSMTALATGMYLAAAWPLSQLLSLLPLALAFGVLGGLLTNHVPGNPVGWAVLLIGLSVAATMLFGAYAGLGLHPAGEEPAWPGAVAAAWVASWAWMPGLGGMWTLLFLLFPDGPPPGRWRHLVPVAALTLTAVTAALALRPGDLDGSPGTPNPLGLPGGLGTAAATVGSWGSGLLALTGVGALASLAVRWRHGDGLTRQQLKALLVAGCLVLAFYLAQPVLPTAVSTVGLAVTPLLAVGGIAVAVLRYRLYDLDRLVNRTLLFTGLTGLVLVAYLAAGAVAGPPRIADRGSFGPSLAAAAVVATVFDPARRRLERGLDRLLNRRRGHDALAAVVGLGDQVGLAAPGQLLPAVVTSVARALNCPLVALEDAEGRVLATTDKSTRSEHLVAVPLRHAGTLLGHLLLGSDAQQGHPLPKESALGRALPAQVATVLAAAQLNTELTAARMRVVQAARDERDRLRRDLHDGLGPALSGISLGVEAAESMLDTDPTAVAALLDRLGTEAQHALAEIRQLVDGLRPDALDRLGLPAALRQHATVLYEQNPACQVHVTAPAHLNHLPAAVETAAYRIALEALTNARRHAHADMIWLDLADDGAAVHLTVRDNGRGFPLTRLPTPRGSHDGRGVGLPSMRHRAEALGGTLTITSEPGRGSRVHAKLTYCTPAGSPT